MYCISRNYRIETNITLPKIKGYQFMPKNKVHYDGILVTEVCIVKPTFIEKMMKRKIKNRLDFYLRYVIEGMDGEDDSDDTRKALDDLQRYRVFVRDRYAPFLDEKYIDLLEKKFSVLERELRSLVLTSYLPQEEKEVENKRSR